ncbi:hypothetical protein D3C78_1181480 [compost metagenome]
MLPLTAGTYNRLGKRQEQASILDIVLAEHLLACRWSIARHRVDSRPEKHGSVEGSHAAIRRHCDQHLTMLSQVIISDDPDQLIRISRPRRLLVVVRRYGIDGDPLDQ